MKTLLRKDFIRISKIVLDEVVHALPPINPPAIVQQTQEYNPSYWYNRLNLSKLENDFDLTEKILLHLIDKESKGDPEAVSKKGAAGLFGVIPIKSGYKGNIKDPAETALFVAKTLRYLIDHFGSVEKGLAAYNWGMGNLAKKGLHQAPGETKKYISRF